MDPSPSTSQRPYSTPDADDHDQIGAPGSKPPQDAAASLEPAWVDGGYETPALRRRDPYVSDRVPQTETDLAYRAPGAAPRDVLDEDRPRPFDRSFRRTLALVLLLLLVPLAVMVVMLHQELGF